MPRLVEVQARHDHRLWLRYDDGVEGEVDLSELAGRGVFEAWDAPGGFEAATLGEHGAVVWTDQVELCGDSLYLRLTGKSPEELFPRLKATPTDA